MVLWIGLGSVIVEFPDHTHLFYNYSKTSLKRPLKNRQSKGRKDKW